MLSCLLAWAGCPISPLYHKFCKSKDRPHCFIYQLHPQPGTGLVCTINSTNICGMNEQMNEWMKRTNIYMHTNVHCKDVYKSKQWEKHISPSAGNWVSKVRCIHTHNAGIKTTRWISMYWHEGCPWHIAKWGGRKQVTEQHVSSDLTQGRTAYMESICV